MVLGVAGEGDSEVFTMDLLNHQSGVINFRLNGRRLILFHDISEHASGVYIPEINGRLLTFSIVTNAQTTQCIDTQFSDDQTHSLWSFDGHAISGTLKDAVLTPAVFIRCRWQAWNKSFLPSQIYGQNRKRIGQL